MLTVSAGQQPAPTFSGFDLSSRRRVIAAVSGGSDSTALLLLLKDHLAATAPGTELIAATVDHGLRAGSAMEAAAVAALCGTMGIRHHKLRWEGDKPASGLAAAARLARYELLADVASREETDIIVTGHTADDQAETIAMRLARTGDRQGRGLAGMAPATLFRNRTWIVRPLLGERREGLRDILHARHIGWVDDPTNADERYERPRIRAKAGSQEEFDALLAQADQAASARQAAGETAARLIAEHADAVAPGLVRLRAGLAAEADPEVLTTALRLLLAIVGGMPFLPDTQTVAALIPKLSSAPSRATLSRVLIDHRRTSTFLVREARDLPAPGVLQTGSIWDGRYRALVGGWAQAGAPPSAASIDGVPDNLLRQAARSALHLSAAGGTIPGVLAEPILAPWLDFLPGFDLAPATALARLFGAAAIPASPWRGHIGRKA